MNFFQRPSDVVLHEYLRGSKRDEDATLATCAAVGEYRRSIGQARPVLPVLLVAPGGEPSDAAAVLGHVAANRGATAARGITETAQQEEKSINKDIRDRAVSEKSVRAEAEPGLRLVVRACASIFGVSWAHLDGKLNRNASERGSALYTSTARNLKTGILDDMWVNGQHAPVSD